MTTFLVAYLFCGALVGFFAGLFGIGGGVIGIPMLLMFFTMQGIPNSIAMHMAIGTSLAIVVVTSVVTLYAHYRRGVILFSVLKKIIPGAMLGCMLGVVISNHINSDHLQIIFGIFLLLIALRMFLNREIKATVELPTNKKICVIATLLGTLSGMLGLGGGVLMVPYLSWIGIPIRNAIGTATACILPAALVAATGYLLTTVQLPNSSPLHSGLIYWPAFIGVSIASVACAPLGVRVGHLTSITLLKKLFAVFLFLIGIIMLIK